MIPSPPKPTRRIHNNQLIHTLHRTFQNRPHSSTDTSNARSKNGKLDMMISSPSSSSSVFFGDINRDIVDFRARGNPRIFGGDVLGGLFRREILSETFGMETFVAFGVVAFLVGGDGHNLFSWGAGFVCSFLSFFLFFSSVLSLSVCVKDQDGLFSAIARGCENVRRRKKKRPKPKYPRSIDLYDDVVV